MPLIGAGPLTVTTPGTKVAVSSLILLIENGIPISKCHGILFQALSTNGGTITLYQRRDGVDRPLAVLGVPTVTFIPSFSAALTWSPNSIGLTDLYVDASVGGEGVLVDVLIG